MTTKTDMPSVESQSTSGGAPTYKASDIDIMVEAIGGEVNHVVALLHAVQEKYRYLPAEALERICELTKISPSQITGVSTFYKQFRHKPIGKHLVRVCTGTACHVSGARSIYETFLKEMGFENAQVGESLTDAKGKFSIEEVSCVGCCTLAPVASIDDEIYGPLANSQLRDVLREVDEKIEDSKKKEIIIKEDFVEGGPEIRIALDSCCLAQGAKQVFEALRLMVYEDNLKVRVKSVACVGMSCKSPLLEVFQPGKESVFYGNVQVGDVQRILYKHFTPPKIFKKLKYNLSRSLDVMLNDKNWGRLEDKLLKSKTEDSQKFLDAQVRIATEFCGEISPLDLKEYRGVGGFKAFEECLKNLKPLDIIDNITKSGLRGRGGGGFPSGVKWKFVQSQNTDKKYVICNGDEGDPGAFMDRMILESYPFRVIEGLAIAALAVGADEGILYIRAEYPLAIERVREALKICEAHGILGEKIMGSDKKLTMSIFRGAGAFICGEETALIASMEGGRGVPRTRPPYPAVSGFWEKPTLINNVETLANVPWIMRHGADAFNQYGTEGSKGTKVFALAGKINRGGLIEVPMGTTFRQIVEDIGGGIPDGRRFKAVQIGGPSGGCIPEHLADTPIDYEAVKSLGAIMGSGGLVVLDDTDCMVDIARYFVQFTKEESCGQCSIGRIGTTRLQEMLNRVCEGLAKPKDVDELKRLGEIVQKGSLCGLCKTAPNPLLTTLKYFPEEYQAHLEGRCPAGKCQKLIHYVIKDNCIGCTRCAQYCPTDSIPMEPYRLHHIDDETCIRCNKCFEVCPEDAVFIQ